jgi:ATP-binding cassette subfamily B protein RaxB
MIQALGAQRQLVERYVARVTERAHWSIGSDRLERGLDRAMSVVGAAMYGFILWVGGNKVISGEMTVGVFSGFLAIRTMVAGPLASLVGLLESWLRVRGLLERSDDIMSVAPVGDTGASAEAVLGHIEARNLGFRYGAGGRWILRGVDFSIAAGEHVALIGPSGEGKSTLGKLICGLLEPTEGCVLIDGVDVRAYDRRELAARLGVVLQQPVVLEAPVAEALRLRWPEAPLEELERAAKLAALDEVIARLPEGYDAVLAPMASNLSGGERQRVALAQALVGRPLILVLDEATCSLDSVLEQKVLRNIEGLRATVVAIAHRETVIVRAERILEVCDGCVVDRAVASQGSAFPATARASAGEFPGCPA